MLRRSAFKEAVLAFAVLKKDLSWAQRPFLPAAFSSAPDDTPNGLFVANVEGKRNISPLLLGLFEHFETLRGPTVGFFQPIAGEPFSGHGSNLPPRHVELMHAAFGLKDDPASMIGVSRRECVGMLAESREEELLDAIYSRYDGLAKQKQMMLVEGTHSDGPVYLPSNRLEVNAKIAANLGLPFLMILNAKGDTPGDILNRLLICKSTIEEQHAQVLGALLNQVRPAERLEELVAELQSQLENRGLQLLGAVPESPVLASSRLDEIQSALKAGLHRQHSRLDLGIDQVLIAAGSLEATLNALVERKGQRTLVMCDATRHDLLLGLSAAHKSTCGPQAAGLLMTGGIKLNANVNCILESEDSESSPLPILSTEDLAFGAAQKIANLEPDILPSSARKIQEAKVLVARFVDTKALEMAMNTGREDVVTPKKFTRNIDHICAASPQRIVLPEGTEARVLRAAAEVSQRQLARVTLLGAPSEVQAEASRMCIDISKATKLPT